MSGFGDRNPNQPFQGGDRRINPPPSGQGPRRDVHWYRRDAEIYARLQQDTNLRERVRLGHEIANEYPRLPHTNDEVEVARRTHLYRTLHDTVNVMHSQEVYDRVQEECERVQERKVDRFLTSVTSETLETLRNRFATYGQIQARGLCTMILFSRGEVSSSQHNRLDFEYKEAGITVDRKAAGEAMLEIRDVLNRIDIVEPILTPNMENSTYKIRERINDLHYLAFREYSPQAQRAGES